MVVEVVVIGWASGRMVGSLRMVIIKTSDKDIDGVTR